VFQGALGEMVIVQVGIAQEGGFEALGGIEAMGLQDLGNAAIEAFHQAVGLRMARWNQAVFDGLFRADLVDGVGTAGWFLSG
jgi:hypothetical protein